MADSNKPEVAEGQLPIPGLPADWDQKVVSRLVDTVDQVRVKSSGPAIGIARAAVFGILGAFLATIATILFLVGFVRALNIWIPKDVWLVYLILGAIFSALGLFIWSRGPRGAAS